MQRSTEMMGGMAGESDLTGFFAEPLSRKELVHQLAEAGLELWHAPEGFWAVRLKQVVVPVPRPRRRSLRRTK